MTKKQKVLLILVIIPLCLAFLYNRFFEYAGNWLEDYQNYFKTAFLLISIFGSLWLIKVSRTEKNYLWFIFSIILTILLAIVLYIGIAFIHISFP